MGNRENREKRMVLSESSESKGASEKSSGVAPRGSGIQLPKGGRDQGP